MLDEPKDALMEKLHLMNGPYLTNAAMLLFSKDPEKWQLGAYVKIGSERADLPIRRVLSALTVLEIDGYATQHGARRFVRTVEIRL